MPRKNKQHAEMYEKSSQAQGEKVLSDMHAPVKLTLDGFYLEGVQEIYAKYAQYHGLIKTDVKPQSTFVVQLSCGAHTQLCPQKTPFSVAITVRADNLYLSEVVLLCAQGERYGALIELDEEKPKEPKKKCISNPKTTLIRARYTDDVKYWSRIWDFSRIQGIFSDFEKIVASKTGDVKFRKELIDDLAILIAEAARFGLVANLHQSMLADPAAGFNYLVSRGMLDWDTMEGHLRKGLKIILKSAHLEEQHCKSPLMLSAQSMECMTRKLFECCQKQEQEPACENQLSYMLEKSLPRLEVGKVHKQMLSENDTLLLSYMDKNNKEIYQQAFEKRYHRQ